MRRASAHHEGVLRGSWVESARTNSRPFDTALPTRCSPAIGLRPASTIRALYARGVPPRRRKRRGRCVHHNSRYLRFRLNVAQPSATKIDPGVFICALANTEVLVLFREWRRENAPRFEVDNRPRDALRPTPPSCEPIMPRKISRFLGGIRQPRSECPLRWRHQSDGRWRSAPDLGHRVVFKLRRDLGR